MELMFNYEHFNCELLVLLIVIIYYLDLLFECPLVVTEIGALLIVLKGVLLD